MKTMRFCFGRYGAGTFGCPMLRQTGQGTKEVCGDEVACHAENGETKLKLERRSAREDAALAVGTVNLKARRILSRLPQCRNHRPSTARERNVEPCYTQISRTL